MWILVQNTLTGERRLLELEGPETVVGRRVPGEPPPAVELASPLVSPRHLVLRHRGERWTVEDVGLNEVLIDGALLPKRTRQALKAGVELRLGQFCLSLVEHATDQASSTGWTCGARGHSRASTRPKDGGRSSPRSTRSWTSRCRACRETCWSGSRAPPSAAA
jgi:hypothetical protein